MAMGHTEGKGKRVGRGHLSVRVPRWAAAVEPQGAHRPGRVARPRVLSSASRTRTRGSWWWRRRGPGGFRLDERLTAHRQPPSRQPQPLRRRYHGLGSAGYEVGMFRWGESSIESEIVRRRWRRLPAAHPLRQTTPNPDACNGRRLANRMGFGRGDGESDGFRHILCQVK